MDLDEILSEIQELKRIVLEQASVVKTTCSSSIEWLHHTSYRSDMNNKFVITASQVSQGGSCQQNQNNIYVIRTNKPIYRKHKDITETWKSIENNKMKNQSQQSSRSHYISVKTKAIKRNSTSKSCE